MIAHVAEAGEGRGRIVLRIEDARASPLAIEAAILLARAYGAEIEAIAVEDANLARLAGYHDLPVLSMVGRRTRVSHGDQIVRELGYALRAAERSVERIVLKAGVPLRRRTVVDEPTHALALACEQDGPWNLVVLAAPLNAHAMAALGRLLESVAGTTGIIVVGPKVIRNRGPILVAIEDSERLAPMLRVAERLASVNEEDIALMIVAPDEYALLALESEIRLALADVAAPPISTARLGYGDAAVVAESLRRIRAGFVVAQSGGLVVPESNTSSPLADVLESPLMVVR